jgi:uncharacterized protein YdaU (DUF1376 family)
MKFPAFPFYVSDYLSSSKVQQMPLEAEAAYLRLLFYCWQDGSIPADLKKMATLCKINAGRMHRLWSEHLCNCFRPIEENPSRLTNPRVEAVRAKSLERHVERVEAGKKGAEQRWQQPQQNNSKAHGSVNGSANEEPLTKNALPLPLPLTSITANTSSPSAVPILPDDDGGEEAGKREPGTAEPQIHQQDRRLYAAAAKRASRINRARAFRNR